MLSSSKNVYYGILMVYMCMPKSFSTECISGQKPYKTSKDFATADDYARYVRDNLRVGMLVKCKEEYEEVKSGDVGKVIKVGVA